MAVSESVSSSTVTPVGPEPPRLRQSLNRTLPPSTEFRRKATAHVALTELGPRGLSGSAPPCLEEQTCANKAYALCETELHDLLLTLAKARRVGEGDSQVTRCSLARRGHSSGQRLQASCPMRRRSCSIAPRLMIRSECL